MQVRLKWAVAAIFVASCGGSTMSPPKDAGKTDTATDRPTENDAPSVDAPTDGGSMIDAAPEVTPDVAAEAPSDVADVMSDGPACEGQGATCTTNAGGPCVTGRIACGDAGPTCVDVATVADGTTCPTGLCVSGECLPGTNIGSVVDLSKVALTGNRICVEAAEYAVATLTTTGATLATAPVGDCLLAGDEVMLIDAQGTPTDNANVGNWELLTVLQVESKTVTFAVATTRTYGTPAAGVDAGTSDGGADAGAAGQQKLLLVRVPHFGALTIAAGGKLTSQAWNGTTGGVLVLRAATLRVDGTIDGAALGYRGGRWSEEASTCTDNVTTEAGESISGAGAASTARNVGGSGGVSSASAIGYSGDTPIGASPGHAQAGAVGANAKGRTLGVPGAAYGTNDATRLTMGSGPGGNLSCSGALATPHLIDVPGQSGGIVALFASSVTVSATGTVSASPPAAERDLAYAGGYVLVRGATLALGAGRVTAQGSTAVAGSATTTALVNRAGDGYVVLDATGTYSGTTAPAAHVVHGTLATADGGTDATATDATGH